MNRKAGWLAIIFSIIFGVSVMVTLAFGGGIADWADALIAEGDAEKIDQAISALSAKSESCAQIGEKNEKQVDLCNEITEALQALESAKGGR